MPQPLLQPFLQRAARDPWHVVFRSANGVVTCGEVIAAAREEQARLEASGVSNGDLVALGAPSGSSFVVAFVAARLAGACVAFVDHSGPSERHAKIARNLGASWLWRPGDARAGEPLEPVTATSVSSPAHLPEHAAIKLTSGSSGTPKGVLVDERALAADGWNLVKTMGLRADDRFLVVLPMSHSYGFSISVMPMLLIGAELVLAADGSPLEVARATGATILATVPAWLEAMSRAGEDETWPKSLRLLLSAGAPLRQALARHMRERTGLGVHVLYGASEVGGITYDREGRAAERGSVGTPVDGVEVRLVHIGADDARVHVRSAGAGRPWPPEADIAIVDGTFLASDRGRWEDGELILEGRTDGWINVRGKKVDPARVERVLVRIDGVVDVAVVGVEQPSGRGEAVRAVVALASDGPRPVDLIRAAARELAPHEVPRSVVVLGELPRNARGKLDRERLATLAAEAKGTP